ncbi:MAG: filamentous hemagglutinin N-terminal domain-containing protein [Pseudomonadota bacterium]
MPINFKLNYLALLIMSVLGHAAHANPVGGSSTTATFNTVGNQLDVTTNATSSIINWTSFSIANGQTTNIIQPTNTSVSLNRVTGTVSSVIAGNLNSNGKVVLVNQNGIVFSSTAVVNVGGLIASTLNITDADFNLGNNVIAGTSSAQVINEGTIEVSSGGTAALIGQSVTNGSSGVIRAPDGNVWLLAGRGVTVSSLGTPEISATVSAPAGEARNLGSLFSPGGLVAMIGDTVKTSGLINADMVSTTAGRVILRSSHDLTIDRNATIEARGGSVVLDALDGHVRLLKRSVVDATGGTIDINGLTITQDLATGTSLKANRVTTRSSKRGTRLNQATNDIISLTSESVNADGTTERTTLEENSILETPLADLIPPRIEGVTASDPNRDVVSTQTAELETSPAAPSLPSNTGSNNAEKNPMRNRFVCSA